MLRSSKTTPSCHCRPVDSAVPTLYDNNNYGKVSINLLTFYNTSTVVVATVVAVVVVLVVLQFYDCKKLLSFTA